MINDPGINIISSGILRLKVKDQSIVLPDILTFILNSIIVQMQIDRNIGGSIINHWLIDQVKKTIIPILPINIQRIISKKLFDSFSKRKLSKLLIEIAKKGVELAIEVDEEQAINWINTELEHLEIDIDQSQHISK